MTARWHRKLVGVVFTQNHARSPQRFSTITGPNDEILTPQVFAAKFPGTCQGCGGAISAGAQVQGIRVRRDRPSRTGAMLGWIVWHANAQCYNAVVERGLLTRGPAPATSRQTDALRARPPRPEDEWLAAYQQERGDEAVDDRLP